MNIVDEIFAIINQIIEGIKEMINQILGLIGGVDAE